MIQHKLRSRVDFAKLCNAIGILDAVEIGTHQAVFASEFMSEFKGTIVLIDPWSDYNGACDGKFYPVSTMETENRTEDFRVALENMSPYAGRFVATQSTGRNALRYFQDETVGFVYIDALHDYESVKLDIEDWWPKVARGGIFAGHDYIDFHPGVVAAVDEFAKEQNLTINLTSEVTPSWWFRKPEGSQ